MADEKEKEPTEFKTLVYVGREFKKKGTYKSGDHKGEEWKFYMIKFSDGEYERGFTTFSPLRASNTKQLTDLEDGELYNIGFRIGKYTNEHGPQTSRTIFFIGEPRGEPEEKKTIQEVPEEPIDNTIKEVKTFEEEIQDFVTVYKDNTKEELYHLSDFVGAFIRKYKIQPELMAMLKKAFDDKVVKKEK